MLLLLTLHISKCFQVSSKGLMFMRCIGEGVSLEQRSSMGIWLDLSSSSHTVHSSFSLETCWGNPWGLPMVKERVHLFFVLECLL